MMILQGHCQPWWEPADYIDTQYTLGVKSEMCRRLHLTYKQDDLRYSDDQFSMFYRDYNDVDAMSINNFSWLSEKGYSLHMIPPGHIVPSHSDEYRAYRARFNVSDVNLIMRIVIFLEDWKSGHYLEVGDRGFSSWRSGDWVGWTGMLPHTAANLGNENRYTLVITGIIA